MTTFITADHIRLTFYLILFKTKEVLSDHCRSYDAEI